MAVAALLLLAVAVSASPASALEQKLTAAEGTAFDALGGSVAIGGDTIILGAPGEAGGKGAVYVFQRLGDSWTNTAKLTASDGVAGDALGRSVAIDGDTIVAGAPGDTIVANPGQGSLYTFARTGGAARLETAKLTASDGAAGDGLGGSVAIDGDTIVAGAPERLIDKRQGAAYTFASMGAAARTQTAELTASDGTDNDLFGISVAIDGDTIVAGAPHDDSSFPGTAYTFARTGAAARTETAKLTATGSRAGLGSSVGVDGDTIVAGVSGANNGQGSVYTYARTGAAARTQTDQLTASDGATNISLGSSVAIDATTIAAVATSHAGGDPSQGVAYTFARTGAPARTETAKLTDPDSAPGDQFGFSLAIDAGTIVAGAPGDAVGTNLRQGSASVFFEPLPSPPPPPPPTSPPSSVPPAPPLAAPALPSPPPLSPARAKLVLSTLTISPSTFRKGAPPVKISRSPRGTVIRFELSSSATVKLSFARARPGRAVRAKCRPPNRSTRARPRCTRYLTVGSFTVQGRTGTNSVAFTGALSRRKRLAPGAYKLTATPTDSAHNTGQPRTAKLTITAK